MQFTELNKQEQLAKLAEARQAARESPTVQKYKFVSALNEQVRSAVSLTQAAVDLYGWQPEIVATCLSKRVARSPQPTACSDVRSWCLAATCTSVPECRGRKASECRVQLPCHRKSLWCSFPHLHTDMALQSPNETGTAVAAGLHRGQICAPGGRRGCHSLHGRCGSRDAGGGGNFVSLQEGRLQSGVGRHTPPLPCSRKGPGAAGRLRLQQMC